MNRILQTIGNGSFTETDFHINPLTENEIRVRSVMTGVCRSDIDMMMGDFGPLPLHMQGHEGLGQVMATGANINDVNVGDFVATRGEPAYADMYNVRSNEYVLVPEAHPKYIIEPVACGINIVDQAINEIKSRQGINSNLLIIGSGFLAWVAYHKLISSNLKFIIDVLGTSNQELWGDNLLLHTTSLYDVVIDLSGKYELGTEINLNNNALIIDGVGKAISKNEAQSQLWKACTTIRPSPRSLGFYQCMKDAVWMIENSHIIVDSFWTKGYNRKTEWQQAFADGINRPQGYNRGYIKWD